MDWARRQSRNPTIPAGHPVVPVPIGSMSEIVDGLCESLGPRNLGPDMVALGPGSEVGGVVSGAGVDTTGIHSPAYNGCLVVAIGGHEEQNTGCRPGHRLRERHRLSSQTGLGPGQSRCD